MWNFDEKKRHAELRGEELARQAVIAQVEREMGTTNLDDDVLFAAICRKLEEQGYELHETDKVRYHALLQLQMP